MMARRLTRWLVLAAFAAGFVAAPAVHLAFHERAHHHDGDFDHHHDDDHDHHHDDDHDAPFDPDHGRHSIAHFSAAGSAHVDSLDADACCELLFLGLLVAEE